MTLMRKNLYIGIDVGATKIAAGLVSASGKIISREKISTPKGNASGETVQLLADLIQDLLRQEHLKPKAVKGIGIGIPGLVDPQTNRILRTPNMNLNGTKLKERLKKVCGAKIFVGNDVNLGILGEKWLGVAKGVENVVGLFLGTGLGGGVIIQHQLLLGTHGAASEIGHMTIDPQGPPCTCGNRGCLEAFVGRWAIERDIKSAIKTGKKTMITKLVKKPLRSIKSRVISLSLKKKDPLVTKIMHDVSSHLGVACVSLRHLFDPQMIVLGGGVIEACGDFILPIIEKTFRQDRFFTSFGVCKIKTSKLGDDAVMLGAVALVRSFDST